MPAPKPFFGKGYQNKWFAVGVRFENRRYSFYWDKDYAKCCKFGRDYFYDGAWHARPKP